MLAPNSRPRLATGPRCSKPTTTTKYARLTSSHLCLASFFSSTLKAFIIIGEVRRPSSILLLTLSILDTYSMILQKLPGEKIHIRNSCEPTTNPPPPPLTHSCTQHFLCRCRRDNTITQHLFVVFTRPSSSSHTCPPTHQNLRLAFTPNTSK